MLLLTHQLTAVLRCTCLSFEYSTSINYKNTYFQCLLASLALGGGGGGGAHRRGSQQPGTVEPARRGGGRPREACGGAHRRGSQHLGEARPREANGRSHRHGSRWRDRARLCKLATARSDIVVHSRRTGSRPFTPRDNFFSKHEPRVFLQNWCHTYSIDPFFEGYNCPAFGFVNVYF